MKKTNVAVFGAGSMGKNHVTEWDAIPGVNVAYVIDTNPAVQPIAEKVGAEFVNKDIRDSIPREIIENTDIWSIATNTDSHAAYLHDGLDYGKKIFLEKPSTESPSLTEEILRENQNPMVQVDYIEMAHPVLSAIIDDMKKTKFYPAYSFNWRGKDLRNNPRGIGGGQGSRIVLEDLVHDISEVGRIKNEIFTNPTKMTPAIIHAGMKTWAEKYGNDFPYSTDVVSNFQIMFRNLEQPYWKPIMVCEIMGGFDQDEERRYFALKDMTYENGYLGQTLARDNKRIEPVAVKLVGAANVKKLFEHAKNGTASRYNEVIDDCDGVLLDLKPYLLPGKQKPGMVPLAKMIRNLYEADKPSKLICPIGEAIKIEKIAEQVYKKSGKPEAMEYRVIE